MVLHSKIMSTGATVLTGQRPENTHPSSRASGFGIIQMFVNEFNTCSKQTSCPGCWCAKAC